MSKNILLNLELQEIEALVKEFEKSGVSKSDNEIFEELEQLIAENKSAEPNLRFSNSYSFDDVSKIYKVMQNSGNEELIFYLKEHISKFESENEKDHA